VPIEEESQ